MYEIEFGENAIVSLPVNNLAKAIAWYEKNLGFTVVQRFDEPAWCEMSTPFNGLCFGLAEVQKVNPGDSTIMLTVDDLDAAIELLQAKGVQLSSVVEAVGHKVCSFADHDANMLMLRQS